jgi:glutaredoxin
MNGYTRDIFIGGVLLMDVIVFSNDSCIYCQKQKYFLKRQGIVFTEKDITKNKKNMEEFVALEGEAVPFTVIKEEGEVVTKILGFNPQKLMEVLQM